MPIKPPIQKLQNIYQENQKTFWFSFYIFLIFILLWLIINITRIGFSNNEDYWYEAGVPILLGQVIFSAVLGIGFGVAEKKFGWNKSQKLNLTLFFIIWVFSAILWASEPVRESYMNPAPRSPNQEMYPYSDSVKFDLSSQFALIGNGLNNRKSDGTPLYSVFLVFVHFFSGQNYENNMAFQTAIFAIFPAIVYLLGNFLHSRTAAITIATLLSLRGINAIQATAIINTVSPKQMMTDFPTAILISLIFLYFLFWENRQTKNWLIWLGASIGLAFLLRANTLALIGLIPLLVYVSKQNSIKKTNLIFLILLGFLFIETPWGIRNTFYGSSGFEVYLRKFNLVFQERFPETKDKGQEPTSQLNNEAQEKPDDRKSNQQEQTTPENVTDVINIVSNHFFHNIITSTLTLPTSPSFDSLSDTINSPYLYWKPFWDGTLNKRTFIFLWISLGILSLGLGAAIQKNGVIGLVPFFGFLLYQLVNAIGRTSGGRYIVPVDWIIIFYFAIGLTELFFILMKTGFTTAPQLGSVPSTSTLPNNVFRSSIFIFLLGVMLTFFDFVFPMRYSYPAWQSVPVLEDPIFLTSLASTTYTKEQILEFIENEKHAILLNGRVLYPRYFFVGEIFPFPEDGFLRVDYPRVEFFVIGPRNKQFIAFASSTSVKLQNISDVFVLGCEENDDRAKAEFIEAIMVVPYNPEQENLIRQPLPPLQCPLPKLVCDNNGNCK